MNRTLIIFLLSILMIFSCRSKDDNHYFHEIDKQLTEAKHNVGKIRAIHKLEIEKYKRTRDIKFLLSSKYAENYLYTDNAAKKIPIIYEMLRINADRYEYITVAGNFYMGLELEATSPKLCLRFLNEALKTEEKSKEKIFLPHIYHAIGRWYYRQGKYFVAKTYFYKALRSFKKEDKIYIASMYSNFGICDIEMGDIKGAITQTFRGINILKEKPTLNEDDLSLLFTMKGNLGEYYFYLKKYKEAEKILMEDLQFIKNKKKYEGNFITASNILLLIYKETKEANKEKEVMENLATALPFLKNINDKMDVSYGLQNYYYKENDLKNLKKVSQQITTFSKRQNKERTKQLDYLSDVLNGYIIKSINQKYDFQLEAQRRNTALLIVLILILVAVFIKAVINIRKKNKKEKEMLEQEKSILETNKENLEKDIQLQKSKIQNLHLNLNLKMETEKAFLENLKKIRKSKNIDPEETVKDLFFKINNLLQIDEKNNDLINESSAENQQFMEILARRYPNLSKQDLKLCVYFRLNLSSKEISLLENITPGSVRVYKTKIKTKISLDKEQDLSSFLNSLK